MNGKPWSSLFSGFSIWHFRWWNMSYHTKSGCWFRLLVISIPAQTLVFRDWVNYQETDVWRCLKMSKDVVLKHLPLVDRWHPLTVLGLSGKVFQARFFRILEHLPMTQRISTGRWRSTRSTLAAVVPGRAPGEILSMAGSAPTFLGGIDTLWKASGNLMITMI